MRSSLRLLLMIYFSVALIAPIYLWWPWLGMSVAAIWGGSLGIWLGHKWAGIRRLQ
jgi:hypothetical protein